MTKPWDDTLKKLIHLDPPAFVRLFLPQAQFVKEESYILEPEELMMDALLEVLVNGIRMLLHIEFQTYHDKDMPARLLRYNTIGNHSPQNLPLN